MSKSNNKALIYAFLLGVLPFMVNGWVNAKIYTNPALFWGFELFSWVVLPCIIFGYLFKFQHLTWDDLGLHSKINHKKNIELLFFLCLFAVLFTYQLDKICNRIAVAFVGNIPEYFTYHSIQPNILILKWLSTLYFALSAGIVEELYYRGFLYKIIKSASHTSLLYLLISPAIFAIAHWEQGMDGVIASYIFGIFTSLFYLKFKNLWPLIFGHIVTDYFWFSAWFTSKYSQLGWGLDPTHNAACNVLRVGNKVIHPTKLCQ